MMSRILQKEIVNRLWQGKAVVIFGARQVGKTTMLRSLFGVVTKENYDEFLL